MKAKVITIKRQRTVVRVREVSFEAVFDEEIGDDSLEPSNVIEAKAEQIADVLGCSYEEAERIVLGFDQ